MGWFSRSSRGYKEKAELGRRQTVAVNGGVFVVDRNKEIALSVSRGIETGDGGEWPFLRFVLRVSISPPSCKAVYETTLRVRDLKISLDCLFVVCGLEMTLPSYTAKNAEASEQSVVWQCCEIPERMNFGSQDARNGDTKCCLGNWESNCCVLQQAG